MDNLYFTVVKQRPLFTTTHADARPVAEVAFDTENQPHEITSFILDALDSLGITNHDPTLLTECADITRLSDLPSGKRPEQPEWSSTNIKLWVISSAVRR